MTTLAFKATYSDWKLIKTRGVVQVVMEVPLAEADAAYQLLGGMPDASKEQWFAVAALKPEKEAPAKPRQSPAPGADGAKRMDWRDLPPATQAALRCDYAVFQAFLREVMNYRAVEDEDTAASAVRSICNVKSRSELSTDHRKRVLWHQLDSQFEAWLVKERVGA